VPSSKIRITSRDGISDSSSGTSVSTSGRWKAVSSVIPVSCLSHCVKKKITHIHQLLPNPISPFIIISFTFCKLQSPPVGFPLHLHRRLPPIHRSVPRHPLHQSVNYRCGMSTGQTGAPPVRRISRHLYLKT